MYIPGKIGINLTIGDFFQSAIDTYDIVYTDSVWGVENPFVFGHAYKTMGTFLSNVSIGDIIYISINNEVRTFQVGISEYAILIEDGYDFLGQSTGTKLYDSIGKVTLHMYTCHGSDPNGRWLVLARQI